MMKAIVISLLLLIAAPSGAFAQGVQTYVLSSGLVEEIFQKLARQPYADVAPVITKLQAEVQHQPAAPSPTAPNKK